MKILFKVKKDCENLKSSWFLITYSTTGLRPSLISLSVQDLTGWNITLLSVQKYQNTVFRQVMIVFRWKVVIMWNGVVLPERPPAKRLPEQHRLIQQDLHKVVSQYHHPLLQTTTHFLHRSDQNLGNFLTFQYWWNQCMIHDLNDKSLTFWYLTTCIWLATFVLRNR